jgi:hypothetical protein
LNGLGRTQLLNVYATKPLGAENVSNTLGNAVFHHGENY